MLLETIIRNGKAIAAVFGLIILVVIGYFAYISIVRSGKVPIVIEVVPGDAVITIDDKKIGTGKQYVVPGSHVIQAKKEGFADFRTTKYLDQTDQIVAIPMIPESDEAKKWADTNQDLFLKLEGQAGVAANQEGESFRTKNPIVNLLPHENLLYTIGYQNDESDPTGNSIIITIDAADGYRQSALYQIYQWGYDPTQFKINFRDYANPFSS